MKYIVCVTLRIKQQHCEDFKLIMHTNAMTSLQNEEGCLQFDVCSNPDEPCHVFLYEAYTSKLAFEEHLNSEHYLLFDAKTKNMIEEKIVKTFSSVS